MTKIELDCCNYRGSSTVALYTDADSFQAFAFELFMELKDRFCDVGDSNINVLNLNDNKANDLFIETIRKALLLGRHIKDDGLIYRTELLAARDPETAPEPGQ